MRFTVSQARLCIATLLFSSNASWGEIQYNRDVRPILAENCFKCHGPDPGARQAGLRLDTAEGAVANRDGRRAIVPTNPTMSELIARITHQDDARRMPPVDSGKQLSSGQIELLREWIANGATYEKHWSFTQPVRTPLPNLPASAPTGWPRNPIDHFVLDRLMHEGLRPSAEADRRTLIRRVTLDLTGLPPTLAEIESFLSDKGSNAYERLVRRLLKSPHYGERMTLEWLDGARYADTHGFNNDSARVMWRWRDWVIGAFNDNLSFDQFLTDQLAGDLIPNATLDQRIATGFNRNHGINSEGGIIGEEYRVEYVADRVRTSSMVFMGLTLECARCHDHKYDPITQRDYYRLFALFNNVAEAGEDGRTANATPIMAAPTDAQQLRMKELETAMQLHAAAMTQKRELLVAESRSSWLGKLRQTTDGWKPAYPKDPIVHLTFDGPNQNPFVDLARPEQAIEQIGQTTTVDGVEGTALRLDGESYLDIGRDIPLRRPGAEPDSSDADEKTFSIGVWIFPDERQFASVASKFNYRAEKDSDEYGSGYGFRVEGERIAIQMSQQWPGYSIRVTSEPVLQIGRWQHVLATYDGSDRAHGVRLYHNGRELRTTVLIDGLRGGFNPGVPLLVGRMDSDGEPGFRGRLDDFRLYGHVLTEEEISAFVRPVLLQLAVCQGHNDILSHHHLVATDSEYLAHWSSYKQAKRQLLELEHEFPSTMVMSEMPEARPAYVLERGHYAARGEQVDPGVLEELLIPLPEDAPRNRLGLARWLVRPDHPLTARVAVNRIWQQFFGIGIVKSAEDFGFQGQWPSHPGLLDFLAVEFVESGWNIKQLVEWIVTSATYRQESKVDAALLARDPENRLLARGPRFRLPAELIRDQALAVAGLLDSRLGGPSVYPYQPDGFYKDIVVGAAYPGTKWLTSVGPDLYRRSIYTFWKRTLPHPAMVTFDAPEREVCTVRRSRTNTPLQALVLLNDPTFLEAARELAETVIARDSNQLSRIKRAFEIVTARQPTHAELSILDRQFRERLNHYQSRPDQAEAFLRAGDSSRDQSIDSAELAALTTITSILLNLDETITKG